MKSVTRKYIEFGTLCLLAAAILWWFGRKLNWQEVRQAVSHANPYLLGLAVLVISLAYFFRAARWGALLAPLSPAGLRNLFIATTVGFGAVFLFGRTGEVVRPVVLPMRDARIRPAASFVTIMVERIYDMIAVVLLFAVNLLWFRPPVNAGVEFSRVRIAGIVLLIVALAGVFGLTQFRKKSQRAIGWIKKTLEQRRFVPMRLTKALLSILEQLASALRVLVDARELAATVGWSALVWLAIVLANLLVFRAFGLPFGVTQTVFVLGWSLVGSLVPTPGGAAGAFHAATAAGLISLGVPRDTAAAISIVLHIVDFGPALIFGVYYILRGDINLSRLRAKTSSESVEHAVEDEPILPDKLFAQTELETAAARD
ncbi:MAG TPA: lysylphosphatidylglycerol synthase transmembrane domain-containing protein [Pyrinomonadaceae bacterium]|nr:lysylphosphatidylglycerol synthase transmembrane domain-containing protein [Pyrinomonadaceae bacterium]